MFSSVRDGYYIEMRRVRRSTHCFNGGSPKNSMDSSLDLSTRSGSPNDPNWLSFDQTLEHDEEADTTAGKQMDYLKPPACNAQLRSYYYWILIVLFLLFYFNCIALCTLSFAIFTSNADHWLNELSNNARPLNEWPLYTFQYLSNLTLYTSLCEDPCDQKIRMAYD